MGTDGWKFIGAEMGFSESTFRIFGLIVEGSQVCKDKFLNIIDNKVIVFIILGL